MKDMLSHAYYWRVDRVSESGEPPVRRYVERWGRPGDTALIAIQDFQRVGAAWYRLFSADNPGYGFVDEETPELAIAVVPSRRGRGIGEALLEALCERARADGYHALSLSAARDNDALVSFYEQHGFSVVDGGDDQSVTMRRQL
jgi:ribosomal protein S18 acetylase RimI-like enzyme